MGHLVGMPTHKSVWLLVNSKSGSCTESALDGVRASFEAHGAPIARQICFPEDDLPTSAELADAGIDVLAIFTGDGTLNAAIAGLSGWEGAVLVLPGGTMNLLCNRLHGDEAATDLIVERWATGASRRVRPKMVRCSAGDALAGLLVGPGTSWANVREAMRDLDLPAIAQGTGKAISETAGGAMVACREPRVGREEGYPLIEITPSHRGMQIDAFYADDAGDFLQQGFALLRRRFREGPHQRLGLLDEAVFAAADGQPLPVLVDGEPGTVEAEGKFWVADCEVDLLATAHGY